MTITNDPRTTSIHQQHEHPLDQEGKDRTDKQSPNRAGIRMPRAARPAAVTGIREPRAVTQNVPEKTARRGC